MTTSDSSISVAEIESTYREVRDLHELVGSYCFNNLTEVLSGTKTTYLRLLEKVNGFRSFVGAMNINVIGLKYADMRDTQQTTVKRRVNNIMGGCTDMLDTVEFYYSVILVNSIDPTTKGLVSVAMAWYALNKGGDMVSVSETPTKYVVRSYLSELATNWGFNFRSNALGARSFLTLEQRPCKFIYN